MKYRMYVLVLRQLDGINKGIQAAHACLEYALKYNNTEEYQNYINNDKTIIILNGGTSNDLDCIYGDLLFNRINFGYFREPDLNNTITALCFLVEEHVYNGLSIKEYMDVHGYVRSCIENDTELYEQYVEYIGGSHNALIKDIISNKRLAS